MLFKGKGSGEGLHDSEPQAGSGNQEGQHGTTAPGGSIVSVTFSLCFVLAEDADDLQAGV